MKLSADEARKLIGGYATGSLTEAERKSLFEAALADQDLFDELAGEQVLKEVLDEPGARQRLVAALEPPARHWGWLGALAAASLAIVLGVVVSQRSMPEPQQIAQVEVAKAPEAPAVVPPPAPPALRKVAPPAEALKKADQTKPQAFDAVAEAPAAMRAERQMVNVDAGFAFTYAVRADRTLQIVPAAPGFLSVTANGTVIYSGQVLSAGTQVQILIPLDATSLLIGFSVMQGIAGTPVRRDEASGTVTDQAPPNGRIFIQLFLKPVTR